MSDTRRSICLVSGAMVAGNLRLQPWRYLHEVARQLAARGHAVTLLSDGAGAAPAPEDLQGVAVRRVRAIGGPRWRGEAELRSAIEQARPDVVLWHVGLTSFLHQRPVWLNDIPAAGIFTSPVYRPRELARLGLGRIVAGYRLSAAHLLGALVPRRLIRQSLRAGALRGLVVQTDATRRRLIEDGLPPDQISLIPPGIDDAWGAHADDGRLRGELGYRPSDTVVLYFGSPAPLRGLHALIRATEIARQLDPSLKLLVLSRRRAGELIREDAGLRRLLSGAVGRHVRVVRGFLAEQELVRHVAAGDVVALPFELIPSDAPLSLLEARALGKPVVTTALGCLAELVAGGAGYLAQPGDPHSLARALLRADADLQDRRILGIASGAAHIKRPQARSWRQVGLEWSNLVQSL